ncbi:fimbrial protein [Pseudescherichia vulneris]
MKMKKSMSLLFLIKRFLLLSSLLAGLGMLSPVAFAANTGCVSSPSIPGVATLGSVAVDSIIPTGNILPGTERNFSFWSNCSAISAGGTLNIPFVARYYQAASPVTPGIENATATITMAYQ